MNDAKIIYPTNPRKYEGRIAHPTSISKYRVMFDYSDHRENFDTLEEAEIFRRAFAISEDKVKNIVYQYDDRCEMMLTHDCRAIFDYDDFDRLDLYVWWVASKDKPYVMCRVGKNKMAMHNYVLNFEIVPGFTVDHINQNELDNRKANLRIASQTTQVINRGIMTNNTSGNTGVNKCLITDKGVVYEYWGAWWIEDGKQKAKRFSVKKLGDTEAKRLAVEYRQQKERELPAYAEALEHI